MAGVGFNRSPKISQNFYCQLRPRLKVELFMRRTKLSELSSWKVRRLELSSEWVWIIQHVLLFYPNSERFRQFYIFTKRSLNSASWEQQKNFVSAFIFRNNNNIYLYRANSTIQFSNAPQMRLKDLKIYLTIKDLKIYRKKKCYNIKLQHYIRKGFFKKVSLQITFKNLKIGGAPEI